MFGCTRLIKNVKKKANFISYTLRKDVNRLYAYFRMSCESFDEILNLIRNDNKKENTTFREPIGATERLAVTLR